MAAERKGGLSGIKENIRSEGQASSIGSRCSVHREMEEDDASVDKVHSSFRIDQVAELFSKFTGEKEEMLRRIQFDGLMHLPTKDSDAKKKGNRQLAYWLLQRMNPNTGTIDLGDRGQLELKPWDVNLVLGLPYEGEDLRVSNPSLLDVTKKKVKKNLLLDEKDDLDLATVRRVLERELVEKSNVYSKIAFITAAVIWATSYFLAPKGRPPRVNIEILETLVCPRQVYKINWASYVLKTLRDYSCKLKKDLNAQASSVCLDGCLLFIEISYLDNLRFKGSTTTQYNTPRVKDFNYSLLDRLIEMDKVPRDMRQGSAFGNNELRHPSESFYTRGAIYKDMLASVTEECTTTITKIDKEKLLQFIEHYNEEHNKRLRMRTTEFLKVLMDDNHRHKKDVTSLVNRWITSRIFRNMQSTKGGGGEGEEIAAQGSGEKKGDEGNFINFINIYPDENGMTGGDTTENTGEDNAVVSEVGLKRKLFSQGSEDACTAGAEITTIKRGRFKRPANRKPKDQIKIIGEETDLVWENWNGDEEEQTDVKKDLE